MATEEKARKYIREALHSFVKDPPDTPYQHGYMAALECVAKEAFDPPIIWKHKE